MAAVEILATGPAFADMLILECTVTGQVTDSSLLEPPRDGDAQGTKLEPATVQVEIESVGKTLFIEIDGPDRYSLTETSAPAPNKRIEKAGMTVESIAFDTTADVALGSQSTQILINRNTGSIAVLRTRIKPKIDMEQIDFNGTCKKVDHKVPKFQRRRIV